MLFLGNWYTVCTYSYMYINDCDTATLCFEQAM